MPPTTTPVVPDRTTDPAGYLLAKGWICVGGDPRHPAARWLDATLPEKEKTEKVRLFDRQLARGRAGQSAPVMQSVYTRGQGTFEFSTRAAVEVQIDRDVQAEKAAKQAKALRR